MVMKSANDLAVQSRKIMPRGDWFLQLKLNVFLLTPKSPPDFKY